jgi:integrase
MIDTHDVLDQSLATNYRLYERHKLRNRSPATLKHYERALTDLGQWLGREPLLSDLTDDAIADAMWGLMALREWSPFTAEGFRSRVVALWNWLARKRLVDSFPDVEPPLLPEETPTAWLREEVDRLWDACRRQQGFVGAVPAATFWLGLHFVILHTAERIGAVLKLERERDVDYATGWITFRAETRKGRRRSNRKQVGPDALPLLRTMRERLCGSTSPRLFVLPWADSYLWRLYKDVLRSADLPCDRKSMFHRLRKTAGSFAVAGGLSGSDVLAHADPRMFDRHYRDVRITDAGKLQLHEVLWTPGTDDGLRPAG